MSKQVLIIGGGLGGLFLGKLLTRERWDVTILEQGAQPGGALQTFVREGIRFDTGFHSVGGMEPAATGLALVACLDEFKGIHIAKI